MKIAKRDQKSLLCLPQRDDYALAVLRAVVDHFAWEKRLSTLIESLGPTPKGRDGKCSGTRKRQRLRNPRSVGVIEDTRIDERAFVPSEVQEKLGWVAASVRGAKLLLPRGEDRDEAGRRSLLQLLDGVFGGGPSAPAPTTVGGGPVDRRGAR